MTATNHHYRHRAYWPWEPEEDLAMVEMKIAGKPAKTIARELQREAASIHSRMQVVRNRFVERHPTLRRHRQEELELLRKLLIEARLPERQAKAEAIDRKFVA